MGQDLEGDGLQGVAGQHGRRLVVGVVHAGVLPPALVGLHARQVVVDDGIGVDALQRAGGAQHRPLVQVEHLGGFQREEGPQPAAGPEGGVAHGLGEARLRTLGAGQQLVERDSDEVGRFGNPLGEGQSLHACHPRPA